MFGVSCNVLSAMSELVRACFLTLVLVWATSAAAAANEPSAPTPLAPVDLQQPGMVALKQLNEAPIHLEPRAEITDQSLMRCPTYFNACSPFSMRCVEFVERHGERMLQEELPSNPGYWDALWTLLESPPVERYSVTEMQLGAKHSYQLYAVLKAMRHWPKFELANGRRLDPNRAALLARESRRRWLESDNLLESGLYLATVHGTQATLGLAMAQAVRDRRQSDLEALYDASEPIVPAELLLGRLVLGEAKNWPTDMPESLDDYPAWLNATYRELPAALALYLEETHTPQQYVKLLNDTRTVSASKVMAVEFVDAVSGQSLTDAFDPQKQMPVPEALEGYQGATFDSLDLFLNAVVGQYHVAVSSHAFRALADIYIGHSAPGVPLTPAPAFFTWDWRQEEAALCLVPTPEARKGTAEVCAPYFDLD